MKSPRIAIVVVVGILATLGAAFGSGTAPAGAASPVTVHPFGGAPSLGAPTTALNAPIVGMASARNGRGYWLLGRDGGIFSYGSAKFYGSTGAMVLNQPVVGIAATRSGRGYWLVASDGGIFTFGDARFYGSTGAMRLNQPIVGMAATPSGRGYWLVASDGGIFTFGDARFRGSTGGSYFGSTIAGMAATPSGRGYWLAAADGRVFSFGDAPAFGRVPTSTPIAGVLAAGRTGLWLVAGDGAVFTLGTARYSGGANGGMTQAVGIAKAAPGRGYWIATVPSGPPLPANSGFGLGRRIVYSNAQQRLWLVESNEVVSHSFLVSGRHGLPKVGVHHVWMKVPTSPSGSLTLPWTLKFAWSDRGNPIDIHGIPLDTAGNPIQEDGLLGTPQSHGCIRMKQSEALFVWNWSEVGTTVVVTDLGW